MTYKGFDKDLKCRGSQYEIGKEYTQKGKISACSNGFHACAVPLDTMSYYPPGGSRYCEVEQSGTMRKGSDDSKVASSKIKVGAEIGLTGLIKAQIAYVAETCKGAPEKIAQGDGGHAAAQGKSGHAAAQGYMGHAAAQGSFSHAAVAGKDAIAAAFGIDGRARAALGSWIMCAEWVYTDGWHIKDVRVAQIDGETLKPDTWYMLEGGEFVEVDENE